MKDQYGRDLSTPSVALDRKLKYEQVWFVCRVRDGYEHTCESLAEAKTLLEARDACNSLNADLPIGADYWYKPFRLTYPRAKPVRKGKRGREHTGRS
jgi:hypothetical protein